MNKMIIAITINNYEKYIMQRIFMSFITYNSPNIHVKVNVLDSFH